MLKAIIFDFDDTLVQTFQVRVEAIKLCGKVHYQQDISTERIKSLWGHLSFDDFIQRVFNFPESLEEIKKKYFQIIKQFPSKLFEGVVPTLELLSQNYKLGIVTSGTQDIITHDMQDIQLDQNLFFKIQFADETNFHKPDPRVLEPMVEALAQQGIQPDETLFVGDSIFDQQAATGAGFQFLAVTTGLYPKEDFEKLGVTTISNLIDLQSKLRPA